ncbi:AAA family ATPase [Xanthobacter sp. 91]|uniref:AAA family ATPase n=1 Tax=Xanthobacter sp. 91 TaxID=1117244 RepID=UPI00049748A9|nr:AAA family ATPase [Xanthobacter sp. 91]
MFRVADSDNVQGEPGDVILIMDGWNDWFVWVTQFYAIAVLPDGRREKIGHVKVGREGMTRADASSRLPAQFPSLAAGWFSIGQSENYYETLTALGPEFRRWFLESLQDCAWDLSILDRHATEPVMNESLLRDIDIARVRNRFHRLAHGNAALTPFAFKYRIPVETPDEAALELTFEVRPESLPPSNVHVLIGRNGVGKTRCFDLLGRAFLNLPLAGGVAPGMIEPLEGSIYGQKEEYDFAGLVTVSFSAFDKYGPLLPNPATLSKRYAYVGLTKRPASGLLPTGGGVAPAAVAQINVKTYGDLLAEFVQGVEECRKGARRDRWAAALRTLESDPLFEEVNTSAIADLDNANWKEDAAKLFGDLSSGHSVVLLTITKLVELVEEKTLVLIDEPEGHLHPPLLSAFVRALSDLLIDRNGVAVVATHSPVVLQEVPKDCVWILSRSGRSSRLDRPETETFGENVGSLTREVFGLEVVQTGFHRMISEAAVGRDYEAVLAMFDGKLGGEAKALARTLTLPRRVPSGTGQGE